MPLKQRLFWKTAILDEFDYYKQVLVWIILNVSKFLSTMLERRLMIRKKRLLYFEIQSLEVPPTQILSQVEDEYCRIWPMWIDMFTQIQFRRWLLAYKKEWIVLWKVNAKLWKMHDIFWWEIMINAQSSHEW